jgi:hypothetical protein
VLQSFKHRGADTVAKRKRTAPAKNGGTDRLSTFLASVDRYVETFSAQAIAVASEGEARLVMQATGESLVAQTRKLTNYFRETAPRLAPAERDELEQFLQVQDAEAAVDRTLQVSAQILAPGGGPLTMNFLNLIDEIMQFIKKILLKLFPDPPGWLQTILLIIDELLNLLKTQLGGLFGLRMSQVADELSRGEVNFLHELKALAELEAVSTKRRTNDEDSSS